MRYLMLILLALLLASPAQAAFQGPGSNGAKAGITSTAGAGDNTVAQVKNLPDDTYVTLTGYLIKQVGKDSYIFRDDTGEIRVEIEHKYFNSQEITSKDKIRITGEIDKEFSRPTEIEVKRLEVLR